MCELGAGRGGAFRLHNNTEESDTVERIENAAEGKSRLTGVDSGREGFRRIHFVFLAFPCFTFFFLLSIGTALLSVSPAADSCLWSLLLS